MKFSFLEGQHLAPFEQRDQNLIAAHRQFLQQGYNKGQFLFSGPSIPPTGGVLIARAGSLEELIELLADEPFCKAGFMRFSKIIEFWRPVQQAACAGRRHPQAACAGRRHLQAACAGRHHLQAACAGRRHLQAACAGRRHLQAACAGRRHLQAACAGRHLQAACAGHRPSRHR
jgi:uncharacterized protein YciI